MEKVSVIIPVYNTTEFLDSCIDSVLQQTHDNTEIIIVNDGSNEECTTKLVGMDDRIDKVKLFHLPENRGVAFARNFGLEKASGDFVYFLDSDDYISNTTLENLVSHIGEFPMITGKNVSVNKANELAAIEYKKPFVIYKRKRLSRFKNRSAVNRLVRMDFIKEHGLQFKEDVKVFSDMEFILPFISLMPRVPYLKTALYFKRKRNDPINNPSLMQDLSSEDKIKDFLKVFNALKDKYTETPQAVRYLDRHFLNFFRKSIVLHCQTHGDIENVFREASYSANKIDKKAYAHLNIVVRQEINYLKNGNLSKFNKMMKLHLSLRKTKRAVQSKRKFFIQMYRSVFLRMPVKEKTIVFESFLGKNYSCSPKYIYEYMVKNNYDYNYVWIFNEKGRKLPGDPKQVKRFSLSYYYYLARAKYWVSNSRLPKHLDKREENVYLQTWHGTPLKKLVFDMNDIHSANPNYKSDFYSQSRRWDYLIAPNQFSHDIFKRSFLFDKEMLDTGYPRNDILHNEKDTDLPNEIKRKIGIPLDKKVILYAPTWRDGDFIDRGKYRFDLSLDLAKLKESLGDEYVVLLRMHYFIANNIDISGFEGFAYELSKYEDIAELYLISDMLITDYSSVFFDYASLRRPILFFAYDLELYRDTLRGFYMDIEKELPGPLVRNTDEIIHSIQNAEQMNIEFKDKYDAFYDKYCGWEDGKASERVVKKVFK
ncbi:bifunctional glycosyltransferase/CDP-glycerol:glycerophosphate glycerophosphotransferase [Terribacillus saccharophilus]|uniref:bifunctional glycosyltransferase/CDP-glycerol:glycerophosphate glycerophosphotransferase n=1 Tax=Terribacillus saccharophilus TaxID=361277 RepID=UPI002DCBEE5A|nr:bifunctional glycosyltransferase family 2 protein/CDP-glycerol:glycerophosphate glycerophosphotransferase [Terribacillus saccharophilus]